MRKSVNTPRISTAVPSEKFIRGTSDPDTPETPKIVHKAQKRHSIHLDIEFVPVTPESISDVGNAHGGAYRPVAAGGNLSHHHQETARSAPSQIVGGAYAPAFFGAQIIGTQIIECQLRVVVESVRKL